MVASVPRPDQTPDAPLVFRDAMVELVQIGLRVAHMIGREADATLTDAPPHIGVAESLSAPAGSLAEAIMADQAAVAAAGLRQTAVDQAASLAEAFARVSRTIRLTVLLAERLDRGWARRGPADDRRAMARRQIARAVEDAIEREADGERAERLTEALADRLESLDVEDELADRPAEDIIREIYRDLGLHPARTVCPPRPKPPRPAAEADAAPRGGLPMALQARPPRRRPDG